MQSENALGSRNTIVAKWRDYKPQVVALAIGIALGPLLTNYLGWQLTRGAAARRHRRATGRVLRSKGARRRQGARQARLDGPNRARQEMGADAGANRHGFRRRQRLLQQACGLGRIGR